MRKSRFFATLLSAAMLATTLTGCGGNSINPGTSTNSAADNSARNNGGSVSNLKIQLEYMCKEMSGYKDVWNAVLNAANIRDAVLAAGARDNMTVIVLDLTLSS